MRKRNLSIILSLALFFTAFSGQFAWGAEGRISADEAEKQASILISPYGATSVQYAVIDQGKIILSSQSGTFSRTDDDPLAKDTLYGIGSVSKMFTAVSVMKLVEMGKINLDTPVINYLPNFKMADVRYKKITVRMLLNHSSGLMGSTFKNAFLMDDNDQIAMNEFLENLSIQRLKADPGEFSVYCNDGFTLAELVVEKVSGMSFTSFVHKYITEPLGMKNTFTPLDNFDKDLLAKLYLGASTDALPTETINFIGAGGLISTAEDLCKFAQIFMDDKGDKTGILSNTSLQSMASPEYQKGIWPDGADLMTFGLGWDNVDGGPLAKYGITELAKGGDTLYHATLVVLPNKNMAAVVLTSGGAGLYNKLLAENLLLSALESKGGLKKAAEQTGTTSNSLITTEIPTEILEFQGIYANMTAMMKVEMTKEGNLNITVPDVPTYSEKYVYVGDGVFKDPTGASNVSVSFVKEENGVSFIKQDASQTLPGLGTMSATMYGGQKMDANPISKEVKSVWTDRNNKTYYLLDQKYSSYAYLLSPPSAKVAFTAAADGYIGNIKIIDADYAKAGLLIPMIGGRDQTDLQFFRVNNKEYLIAQSCFGISEDNIPEIYIGERSVCTIQNDGFARWAKVGAAAGKTMTVNAPENASFAVYDARGACVHFSITSKADSVKLPGGGIIVFAGDVGSRFEIELK